MKRLIIYLYLLTNAIAANAQDTGGNRVTGILMDADSKAVLEYSTITIFARGNDKPLTGTTSDKSGSFTLADIAPGIYKIIFENIGYQPLIIDSLPMARKDAIIDLKNVYLKSQKSSLEGVTVTARTNPIENKIDRIIFNAEKDVSSQGGVATDLLKKIPQISVDADGNVQLSGNSGIRFLINGKPSTAFGSRINDVLQSIPSSQIKSIEVITNPGARYDAQGMGGIINIILKSNNAQGYNGNISLTAGTRMENGSFNFNVKKNDLSAHAFISGNARLRAGVTNNSIRTTYDSTQTTILNQNSSSSFKRGGLQTGMGVDWILKKQHSFSANVSFNQFGNEGEGFTGQLLQHNVSTGVPDLQTYLQAGNRFRFSNTDWSLNYKRTFKKEDQELEINYDASSGNNRSRSSSEQSYLPGDSIFNGIKGFNPASIHQSEITLDYVQPITGTIKFGTGAKGSFYNISSLSDVNSLNPSTKLYEVNQSLQNNLDYKQKVFAAYAELSFPIIKNFSAKIGGRYERTEIDAFYSNAVQQVRVPGYNTFVPSIYLSEKLSDKSLLKLSYSKRIERPDYESLNPFVNTTDPKNLTAGNPFLKPEIGNRIELALSNDLGKTGNLLVNLFYRESKNDIQPFINYYSSFRAGDSVYTNVSVSTRQNIGTETNMGVNLFGDFHLSTKLNLRSNISLFRRHTINAIDRGYNINSFNYRFNINANYQFSTLLVAEFFANFNSPRNEVQGRYPSFTSYTLAVRKQIWKKKGSVALTATNPFNEYLTQRTVLSGPDFRVNSLRKIHFRTIGLNFTWKFGKLEFKKPAEENEGNAGMSN